MRLAIDIGGTFTDIVLENNEILYTKKVLTSAKKPEKAVIEGTLELLNENKVHPSEINMIIHGTTLATNATIPEPEGNNYVFRSCAFDGNPGNGRTIVFEAKAWEEAIGELPAFDSTVLNKEEGQCYSYVGTSQDPATDDLRDYEHRGCRCDGGLEGEE